MQLWWGNAGGGSKLVLQLCHKSAVQQASEELLAALEAGAGGGVDASLFSRKDLALAGCSFTEDLSGVFKQHCAPPALCAAPVLPC